MDRIRKQFVAFFAGTLAFLVLYGLIGSSDYQEIIIQKMGNETYMHIYRKLGGHGTSDSKIVREYEAHQEFYDSLDYWSLYDQP